MNRQSEPKVYPLTGGLLILGVVLLILAACHHASKNQKNQVQNDLDFVTQTVIHPDLAWDVKFRKGVTYYFKAQSYPPGNPKREHYLNGCVKIFDTYVWHASDEAYYETIKAHLYQAMCSFDPQKNHFNGFIQSELKVELKQAKGLAPDSVYRIVELVETAHLLLAHSYYNTGDFEKTQEVVSILTSDLKSEGFNTTLTGDAALLVQAKALVKLGGIDNLDAALVICKDVHERHPTHPVGGEARRLLSEINNHMHHYKLSKSS